MADKQLQFMFSAPKSIMDTLRKYAADRGISVSAVIKQALVKFFKEEN